MFNLVLSFPPHIRSYLCHKNARYERFFFHAPDVTQETNSLSDEVRSLMLNFISFVIIFCLLTIENRWFYVSLSVIGVIASVVACCISPYMVIIYNK